MKSKNNKMVSIGLPVFNGEEYISHALNAILSQDYEDFEIIVCDNASTDKTEEIVLYYVHTDNRISYYRNPKNFGASYNYNKTFKISKGKYFKWAACDDMIASSFLRTCVSILENDDSIVVTYSKTNKIDLNGKVIGNYDVDVLWNAKRTSKRFREAIMKPHPCTAIFGVIKREALLNSPLIAPYFGSDRNLLAELSLKGRIYEIPQHLFFRRDHKQTSVRKYDSYERINWFDPSLKNKNVYPYWKNLIEYFRSIYKSETHPITKFDCYIYLMVWFIKEYRSLGGDIKRAIKAF